MKVIRIEENFNFPIIPDGELSVGLAQAELQTNCCCSSQRQSENMNIK